MHRVGTAIAVAFAIALAPAVSEGAQRKQKTPYSNAYKRPQVIIRDRDLFRAPPPPHDRSYYGPAPTIQPPMERVPLPAPLAQPPIR